MTLLNPAEAAAQLGVSYSQITAMARRKEIGCVKVGRLVRFSPEQIAEYIKNNRIDPKELITGWIDPRELKG